MELKLSYGTTQPRSKMSDIVPDQGYGCRTSAYKMVSGKWQFFPELLMGSGQIDGTSLNCLTKMKVKGEQAKVHPNTTSYQIKLTISTRDTFYAFDQKIHLDWMVRLVWGKHHTITQTDPGDE